MIKGAFLIAALVCVPVERPTTLCVAGYAFILMLRYTLWQFHVDLFLRSYSNAMFCPWD